MEIDNYTLPAKTYRNRLLRLHLFGMRIFGLMIFSDQTYRRLNFFRGICFCVSFVVFNITQVC